MKIMIRFFFSDKGDLKSNTERNKRVNNFNSIKRISKFWIVRQSFCTKVYSSIIRERLGNHKISGHGGEIYRRLSACE